MDYLTDEEQVERLRAWWKEYGLAIVAGIIIAIIVVVGWRYYSSYKTKVSQSASLVYTTMINSTFSDQQASAIQAANTLKTKFSKTPYAAYAALWLAKNAVEQNNYQQALSQLQWAQQHTSMPAVAQVALLRMAEINLQMNKPQQALQLLKTVKDKAYLGLVDEARGDAYLQMKNTAAATAAYQQALKNLPQPDRSRPLLAMKLASLPMTTGAK